MNIKFEYLTKFHVIRPLQRKTAIYVANELLLIFLDFYILQSDNGREFTRQVIHELSALWPQLVLVNESPRHPQSQGSVDRSNSDPQNIIGPVLEFDQRGYRIGTRTER